MNESVHYYVDRSTNPVSIKIATPEMWLKLNQTDLLSMLYLIDSLAEREATS